MDREYFSSLINQIGFTTDQKQMDQFEKFRLELAEWNKKMNLTAIDQEKEVQIKHFYDSLLGMKITGWTGKGQLLDVGSGAGFPGIPLKIMNPALKIVMVDSLKKRIIFLEHMIDKLELKDITAIHARAEDLGKKAEHREKYDWVVSRAVAKMSKLAELCIPLLKIGGVFIAYKGTDGSNEIINSKTAISILGGEVEEFLDMQLPEGSGCRSIIAVKKLKATPLMYPRRADKIEKQPLTNGKK